MKTLLVVSLLSFVMIGCGSSKNCLDGTKWKGKTILGVVTLTFDDGIISFGGNASGSYECLKNGRIRADNGFMNFYGEIDGDTLLLERTTWKKQ